MANRIQYLTREILEELRPEHGDTSMFQYIESRSDVELFKTRKTNIPDPGKHRGIFPVGESLEYVVDRVTYQYSRAENPELYLKLITDYDGVYFPPTSGRIARDLIGKILEIKPEWIDQFPVIDIDPKYYIDYCMANDRIYHPTPSLTNQLLRDREFLFFCWNKYPRILKYGHKHLFNDDILAQFLAQEPQHTEECSQLYNGEIQVECPRFGYVPIQVAHPQVEGGEIQRAHKMTREEFMDPGNRSVPSRLSADMLSDEEVVLKIFDIQRQYMMRSNYRDKFVTKSIFDKVYITQDSRFLKQFIRYVDAEILAEYTERHPIYVKEFRDLYTIEMWIHIVSKNNASVVNIADMLILRDVISQYPKLEPYLDACKVGTLKSYRKKSARSAV